MALSSFSGGEDGEDRYRPMAEINVTPMVDVMLVLLVIFMVTAPLLMVGVPLDLPKTRAAAIVAHKDPLVLSLNRDGEIFLGQDKFTPGELEPRLAALATEDPDRVVFVRGDKTITYAQLMNMLSEVKHAGFHTVSLVAEAAGAT